MTTKTNLRIFKDNVEIPIVVGSSRFIDTSHEPISGSYQAERAIDGTLINLKYDGFDSYAVSISCTDHNAPALTGIFPGSVITVHYPAEFIEPGPSVTLTRDPVPGSIVAHSADGRILSRPEGKTLNVPGAAYFSYRPILTIMVNGFSNSNKERKADARWSISGEEIGASVEVVDNTPTLPSELVEAVGGDEVWEYVEENGAKWRAHRFTSSGLLSVTYPGDLTTYIAAGGGGGAEGGTGGVGGGGGGAGGFYQMSTYAEAGDHAAIVGSGGAAGYSSSSTANMHGFRGSNSSFLGLSASGGGGGISYDSATVGTKRDGGSGGGGSTAFPSSTISPGTGIKYFGNRGGYAHIQGSNYDLSGMGGGGGARGPGGDASTGVSGNGGIGLDIILGDRTFSVCGGGAGGQSQAAVVAGTATHGGGNASQNGEPNTGSGGGGALFDAAPNAGNGASGFIIVTYRIE